jgi:hypothetical protein
MADQAAFLFWNENDNDSVKKRKPLMSRNNFRLLTSMGDPSLCGWRVMVAFMQYFLLLAALSVMAIINFLL